MPAPKCRTPPSRSSMVHDLPNRSALESSEMATRGPWYAQCMPTVPLPWSPMRSERMPAPAVLAPELASRPAVPFCRSATVAPDRMPVLPLHHDHSARQGAKPSGNAAVGARALKGGSAHCSAAGGPSVSIRSVPGDKAGGVRATQRKGTAVKRLQHTGGTVVLCCRCYIRHPCMNQRIRGFQHSDDSRMHRPHSLTPHFQTNSNHAVVGIHSRGQAALFARHAPGWAATAAPGSASGWTAGPPPARPPPGSAPAQNRVDII